MKFPNCPDEDPSFPEKVMDALEENAKFDKLVDGRIRAYQQPHDQSDTFVMVLPVSPASATTPASDNFLAERQHMQIDVQGRDFKAVHCTAQIIRQVMFEAFDMLAQDDGLDTYFEETQRFLVSRNYLGTPKKLNYQTRII